MRGAVFLDRDGTISEEVGYIRKLEDFCLMPHSVDALKMINRSGLKVIVVTNQSGVARGYFTESMVKSVHRKLEDTLSESDVYIDAIYYCPHHPEGVIESYRKKCECRKPAQGMITRASREHDIDLGMSYMVGDKVTDIELAHSVGAKGILVLTGYGREEFEKIGSVKSRKPEYIADDLYDAARWILKDLGITGNGYSDHKTECNR